MRSTDLTSVIFPVALRDIHFSKYLAEQSAYFMRKEPRAGQ